MENIQGSKNPKNIILQYTQDLNAFENFISEDIYPSGRNRSIKYRCTLLLKHLQNPTDNYSPKETPNNSDTEN